MQLTTLFANVRVNIREMYTRAFKTIYSKLRSKTHRKCAGEYDHFHVRTGKADKRRRSPQEMFNNFTSNVRVEFGGIPPIFCLP